MTSARGFRARQVGGRTSWAVLSKWAVAVVLLLLGGLIALPAYRTRVDSVRVSEATERIGLIVTGARAYAQQNEDAQGDPRWPPVWGGGLVDLSSTKNFEYWILSGAGANARTTPMTIVAVGRTGSDVGGLSVSVTVPNVGAAGTIAVVGRSHASGGALRRALHHAGPVSGG
jgi:type II secretory pathway pseudopilin PulG